MSSQKVIYDPRIFEKPSEKRLYSDGDVIPASDVSKLIESAVFNALTNYYSKPTPRNKPQINKEKNIEERLLFLLQDPKYPGRTIRGLSKELGVSQIDILKRLTQGVILGQKVKVYPRKNQRGEKVYTTLKKFSTAASWKDKFIDAIAVLK